MSFVAINKEGVKKDYVNAQFSSLESPESEKEHFNIIIERRNVT